ncbi:MAG: PQQ-binding-like beta-propeller repeat protein [Chloroflexaceae bacterium]|nr:PQQ-binding-like beta-propeller repeat protein [Chloroflexaceae bacterium]
MGLIKKAGSTKRTGLLRREEETSTVNLPQEQEQAQEQETRNVEVPRKDDETGTVGLPTRGDETGTVGLPTRGDETSTVGLPPRGDETSTVGLPQVAPQAGTGLSSTAYGTSGATHEVQALAEGSVLQNRYVVEGILGIGGMSVVYRGRDLRFKDVVRSCAIKEMYQRAPDSQTRMLKLRHFEREAGLLATLSHPAIPKVYDFFEEHGRVYLVQEMIPGKDLETILENEGRPIDEIRVANWAIQICDVLSYLHSHQPEPIVFRDMKPSNILLMPGERVVLIDFGIARILDPTQRKGTMIGTEGYAPPEQYRGVAEPQGDLYALGASLHHLLTGSDPRLETPFTFHNRPLRKYNPAVSPEMEAIINRTLEYDLNARWSSAQELKAALLEIPGMRGVIHSNPLAGVGGPATGVGILLHSGESQTELVWSFSCEEEVRSSPCVSGGSVYIGCYDNNLYALDAASGKFRWKYATEGGISSSPSVWQDLVITGSEDGAVYGVDMRNGSRRWVFRTEKAVRSSPIIQERVVFIGSDDLHFYALDGLRGVLIWKYRAWMPFRSSAGIGKEVIFVGCDDSHVYCLEIRSSTMKWKQRTQHPVISTPCYAEGLVFVGSTDGHLYAMESKGGIPVWKFRTGHKIYSSPIVVGKNVLVGSADGNLYAVDRKTGRQSWKYETDGQVTSSPRHAGGRVYFGSVDRFVYCLDVTSGKLLWKYQTEGPVVSSASISQGIVYIGSMDNHVYALKA